MDPCRSRIEGKKGKRKGERRQFSMHLVDSERSRRAEERKEELSQWIHRVNDKDGEAT